MAPLYEQAAAMLKGKVNVGKIDCTVHKCLINLNVDLCTDFHIQGYPTLMFYQGESTIDYQGAREANAITQFALKHADAPAFELIGKAQIQATIEKNDVAPIFVIEDKNVELAKIVSQVAAGLKNTMKIFFCTEKGANTELGTGVENDLILNTDGGIRTIKYGDLSKPKPTLVADLQHWLKEYQNPLISRLDGNTQPTLMQSEYLVIIALDEDSKAQAKQLLEFRKYVKEWFDLYPTSRVIFSLIDGIKYAKYVENLYGIKPQNLPAYVVTVPKDDIYYDSIDGKTFALDKISMLSSVKAAIQNELQVLIRINCR